VWQERFRPVISGMPAVIDAARRMVRGAVALQMPVVVTEQYPKALGNTVEELKGILPEGTLVQDKFDFTMMGVAPFPTIPPRHPTPCHLVWLAHLII